ncbi:hypothetical protein GH714_017710 [Hevea brasiliensis]|uniref:Uncharacterized protein n=1 Tax=Hevea brasiliensis TaxID=3981 RepID=A0A6A6KR32_HEVBR|nr:hypothetical protein GH714_017710 [Hevea brasiliensis]
MPLPSSSKTMDGSATLSVHAQNVLKECDTSLLPATKHSSSHRTPSFSSFSSCSFSEFPDDFPPNPATPRRFSGVPFSWEHLPGIPKKPSCKKKDSTVVKALPLPPHTSKRFNLEEVGIIRKKNSKESFGKDPFFTALVECSKGDDEEDHSGSNFWNVTKYTFQDQEDHHMVN